MDFVTVDIPNNSNSLANTNSTDPTAAVQYHVTMEDGDDETGKLYFFFKYKFTFDVM